MGWEEVGFGSGEGGEDGNGGDGAGKQQPVQCEGSHRTHQHLRELRT